ncbi:MAG TPA: PAS domain S-box protein [Gemmatimonadaceae bacterium]|jgi:PAS domain S-box-containing protein|nr:PAS domain S-box protein [Gemmatimonadaceae bacterium]
MSERKPGDDPSREAPRDIGARHSAAAFLAERGAVTSLAQSGGLYQLLVESVIDYAIFALDPTGIVITWNAGAQHLKGYRAEEIIGRHFSTFYRLEDRAAGKPEWELEVAARDGRVEDEGWRLRKDGTLFWANVVITALRDPQGQLVGYAKVTRDLTERRRAEETLRSSEERFRLLVESVKDYGIFMLDPDGRIASWNEGARRIKGYEASEIVGRHFSIFYPREAVERNHPQYELEVARAEGRFEEEGWRVRKDGTLFWANVVITALFSPSGTLLGYTKVTRDLTERREAQRREVENARRVAEAEASNRAKSGFLAAMSHELRTPLNAIAGYAQLMDEGIGGDVSSQHREWLTRIRNSQLHLLAIVNDLLNYTRIEAGEVAYERVPVSLHDVVEGVLQMVEPQAVRRSIRIEHGPCPSATTAQADRLKVEQIAINLLSNAVKFTTEGGSISVACQTRDATASITVRDTGPGIAMDQQQAIFEPFVQLGRTLTSAHEGTGLGLAISRDLARAMGGDVTVESEPGVGSAFVLTLPAT